MNLSILPDLQTAYRALSGVHTAQPSSDEQVAIATFQNMFNGYVGTEAVPVDGTWSPATANAFASLQSTLGAVSTMNGEYGMPYRRKIHTLSYNSFFGDPRMSTPKHQAYLSSVSKVIRLHSIKQQRQRVTGVRLARKAVRMGADPVAAVAALIPPPATMAAAVNALSPQVVQVVTNAFTAITSTPTVPTTSVQEGIATANSGASGPQLDAARTAQPQQAVAGFDAGIALAAGAAALAAGGAAAGMPAGLDAAGQAGWLLTHGLAGADPSVKMSVMKVVSQVPNIMEGAGPAVQKLMTGITPAVTAAVNSPAAQVLAGAAGSAAGAAAGKAAGQAIGESFWDKLAEWWDDFKGWFSSKPAGSFGAEDSGITPAIQQAAVSWDYALASGGNEPFRQAFINACNTAPNNTGLAQCMVGSSPEYCLTYVLSSIPNYTRLSQNNALV